MQLAPTTEFFDRLEEDLGHPRPIQGKLYFEYHRGTYTSQARTKRGNRAGERLLHEAEDLGFAPECPVCGRGTDECTC